MKKMSGPMAMKMPGATDENCSINVRKIENGYLVTKTYFDGKDYAEETTFSATKPEITLSGAGPGKAN